MFDVFGKLALGAASAVALSVLLAYERLPPNRWRR